MQIKQISLLVLISSLTTMLINGAKLAAFSASLVDNQVVGDNNHLRRMTLTINAEEPSLQDSSPAKNPTSSSASSWSSSSSSSSYSSSPPPSPPKSSANDPQQDTKLLNYSDVQSSNSSISKWLLPEVTEVGLLEALSNPTYLRHSVLVSVITTIAYSIVVLVGVIGNSFVVTLVCKSPPMRTVTNLFIVNLAVADILVLVFCLPPTLIGNIFVPYVLGRWVCKTASYLQGVAVSASINTMVVVTMDRFLAICFPMDWHMSRRDARLAITCIWLFSLTISLPWAIYFTLMSYPHENTTVLMCVEDWPSERMGNLYFIFANLILCYLLPAALVILCYLGIWYKIERRSIPGDHAAGLKMELIMQKSKIKVVKMMIVVVLAFLLSWLPTYIIFVRIKLTSEELSSWEESAIRNLMPFAQWLGASNSCINPVLYTFFNRKYRDGFMELIRRSLCCMPNMTESHSQRDIHLIRLNDRHLVSNCPTAQAAYKRQLVTANGNSLVVGNTTAPNSELPSFQDEPREAIGCRASSQSDIHPVSALDSSSQVATQCETVHAGELSTQCYH